MSDQKSESSAALGALAMLGAIGARAAAFAGSALVLFYGLIKAGIDPEAIKAVLSDPALAASSLLAYSAWRGLSLLAMTLGTSRDGQKMGKEFGSIWTPLAMALSVCWFVPVPPQGINAMQMALLTLRDVALRLV